MHYRFNAPVLFCRYALHWRLGLAFLKIHCTFYIRILGQSQVFCNLRFDAYGFSVSLFKIFFAGQVRVSSNRNNHVKKHDLIVEWLWFCFLCTSVHVVWLASCLRMYKYTTMLAASACLSLQVVFLLNVHALIDVDCTRVCMSRVYRSYCRT
jgi:hypothetical protein